ncbi:MAG: MFS transporter [Herpetosiphon sp.]
MSLERPANGWRTFVIVWLSQAVSVLGSALTLFAINIWLLQDQFPRPEQRPQLAAALSALSLAFGLPPILGAPIAGAWADRHDRKRTMLVANVLLGGLSLCLAFLVASGQLHIPLLLAVMVLMAIGNSFHGAGFDTSYATLVPPERLPRANGMMQTVWSLQGIVSPALAAGIISLPELARRGMLPGLLIRLGRLHDGTALAMVIDAGSFFLSAAVLPWLVIPSPQRLDVRVDGAIKKSIWADIGDGAAYIWRRPPFLWLLGVFTVANFVGGPLGIFEALMLKYNLAGDWAAHGLSLETALALLGTVASAGGVAGGIMVSTWGGLKRRRVLGVLVPMMVYGVALVGAGLASRFYGLVVGIALATVMLPLANTHSQAIWQAQTPHELQGRVFSVRRLIAQCTFPLSTGLAGWIGALFNPGSVLAWLGAALFCWCFVQLFNPQLRHVEDKAWLDRMALGRGRATSDSMLPHDQKRS